MNPELIRILDITAAVVGIAYLWWEFKASILVWVAGIIMPAIDLFLYWERGLYGDFALAVYYLLAAVYGYVSWKWLRPGGKAGDEKREREITHTPKREIVPLLVVFCSVWAGVYLFLAKCTNSNVPVLDSLTNALSIVGMWMLAQKRLEQWFVWLITDAIYVGLYFYKDLPGKTTLYIIYTIVALAGYFNWKRKMEHKRAV